MDAENAEERKLRACPYSILGCFWLSQGLLQHELEQTDEWSWEWKLYVELRVESGKK